MREIKFRVWNKELKKFGAVGGYIASSQKGIFGIDNSYVEDFEVQVYTGLKDKNGVEIYEGDLLTYADNTTPEQIFEVKFLDERGTFVFRELYNPTFEGSDLPGWDDTILGQNAWDGWEIADAAKVIGNIFEGVDK